MRTYHFAADQWLPVPLEKVFAFFSDARNLDAITPDWLQFHIATPGPIEMKPGALIDYRLKIRGLPIGWQTEILEWAPPHRFVDVQKKGPYRLWHHTHLFEEADGGTWVRDRIDYAVPGWFLAPVIHRFFVRPDIEKIFAHRQARMEDLLRTGQGGGGTTFSGSQGAGVSS